MPYVDDLRSARKRKQELLDYGSKQSCSFAGLIKKNTGQVFNNNNYNDNGY